MSIIRPHLLEAVKTALQEAGVSGMTVSEVKLRIETVVADGLVDPVVDAILKTARTGKFGDGKVFVTAIAEVVRIRTGEYGDAAV